MAFHLLSRRRGTRVVLPGAASALLLALGVPAFADPDAPSPDEAEVSSTTGADDADQLAPYNADGHAPIGVMAEHMHNAGEFMLSYRFQPMAMSGLQDGSAELADAEALAVDNPFFGNPGQPPKMRILPREMPMNMHMFGAMLGIHDRVTLMGMGMFMSRDMTLETHNMMGAPIGTFEPGSSGIGDSSLSAMIGLSSGEVRAHLIAGVGIPTGSLDTTGEVLLPTGMQRELRLPYAMQLGSGTFDAQPGIVVQTKRGNVSVGGQLRGKIRFGENSEGYRLGNEVLATAWAMVQPVPAAALTARVQFDQMGAIEGQDGMIAGPVPTADPSNYGGTRVTGLIGLNLAGQSGAIREHRLAFELGIPLYQDLNGPQMPRSWQFIAGWQRAWSFAN